MEKFWSSKLNPSITMKIFISRGVLFEEVGKLRPENPFDQNPDCTPVDSTPPNSKGENLLDRN
jgi:hypothetical protein